MGVNEEAGGHVRPLFNSRVSFTGQEDASSVLYLRLDLQAVRTYICLELNIWVHPASSEMLAAYSVTLTEWWADMKWLADTEWQLDNSRSRDRSMLKDGLLLLADLSGRWERSAYHKALDLRGDPPDLQQTLSALLRLAARLYTRFLAHTATTTCTFAKTTALLLAATSPLLEPVLVPTARSHYAWEVVATLHDQELETKT
ncbi:hypothetical protein LTR78_009675 [Recurvomyces mirabilis]|uniref:Uncharacterized protein n=1 Tax=Recurvomyces mirabilis TaxID=574656 RepID=A0AAE0WID8_9PEZI|nr:hypothetical protein LTR78_009675 [Recurvomyces mirabilis]KAK5150283.1 hypothetical protein LTS14_010260 [Recurvomyces mirabilis]